MEGFKAKSMRFRILSNTETTSEKEGLLAFVFSYVKRSLKNVIRFSKAEWVVLIGFIVIWAVTGVLKTTQPNNANSALDAVAFLTASYNGLQQGTLSVIGGVFAKGAIIAIVAGTPMPTVANGLKGNFKNQFKGISQFFKQLIKLRPNDMGQLSKLVLGIGLALVAYNFLSVDGSFQNNFISILLAMTLIGRFGDESSFIVGFLNRIFKKSPNKTSAASALQMGLILGYALSIPLSLTFSNTQTMGFIVGGIVSIIGISLMVFARTSKKEAK